MDMGASRQGEQLWLALDAVARRPRARVAPLRVRLPVVRGECEGEGVCLKLSCKWNTTLDITHDGALKLNAPSDRMGERRTHVEYDDDVFDDMVIARLEACERNCALDAAAEGGMAMDDVAEELGQSREGIRKVEIAALLKIKCSGIDLSSFLGECDDDE